MAGIEDMAFLRIPPFPGSNAAFLRSVSEQSRSSFSSSSKDAKELMQSVLNERVGGIYWGSQPPLPQEPYNLFEVADPQRLSDRLAKTNRRAVAVGQGRLSPAAPFTHVPPHCDPWHLVRNAVELYSETCGDLAIIAGLCGVTVYLPAANGTRWEPLHPGALQAAFIEQVVAPAYVNPFTGAAIDVREAIALCGFWRSMIDRNRPISAALGFAFWKRETIAPLLWSGASQVPFTSRAPEQTAGAIAIWRSRARRSEISKLEAQSVPIIEVEDGFIRSAGLGADCVPPLSIVVDHGGIYFDPARASDLEDLLQNRDFAPDLLTRASQLRGLVVEGGISKYSAGKDEFRRRVADRPTLLVTGQVEDDRAVLSGCGPATNLELLRLVRQSAPGCYVIYKPHPDVEAGHRKGKIDEEQCLEHADEIVRAGPITSLIESVDEVHVNTSLAGFEALLRNKRVVTYGVPFYAGWGLTEDRGPVPSRRSARRTLDELVAATLLVYPRYLDPITKLPCPPEILIRRLTESVPQPPGLLVSLRRAQGMFRQRLSSLLGR
jgi:capsular polysaccharide export protein